MEIAQSLPPPGGRAAQKLEGTRADLPSCSAAVTTTFMALSSPEETKRGRDTHRCELKKESIAGTARETERATGLSATQKTLGQLDAGGE